MLSSVGNALRVLELVVDGGEMGVSEIARSLGLTVGTSYRLVATLTEAGYLDQDAETRRYRPGSKIPDLARRMRPAGDFVDLAHARLARLQAESAETVNLGILRDGYVVYVDRAVSEQPLAVAVQIGSRVPAYCTSLGRAILAFSDPGLVDEYVSGLGQLAAADSQTPPTRRQLREILDRTRSSGFAADDGEFAEGIACVGAPILDERGEAVAAVSVSGPTARMRARKEELTSMVQLTAKELSELYQSLGRSVSL